MSNRRPGDDPRNWPWWYWLFLLGIFVGIVVAIVTCDGPGC